VRLVINDAHEGLKGAIGAVLLGAAWQRCRVHFLRNVLARIPKGSAQMVLAAIRTIWAQPDPVAVGEQLDEVAAKLEPRFPAVAAMLIEAKADLTAFAALSVQPLAKDLVDQPARAGQQGDQAADRRRRDLPQRGGHHPTRRGGRHRDARRVGHRGAALSGRGLDGAP
jgi:mutator family transposase